MLQYKFFYSIYSSDFIQIIEVHRKNINRRKKCCLNLNLNVMQMSFWNKIMPFLIWTLATELATKKAYNFIPKEKKRKKIFYFNILSFSVQILLHWRVAYYFSVNNILFKLCTIFLSRLSCIFSLRCFTRFAWDQSETCPMQTQQKSNRNYCSKGSWEKYGMSHTESEQ